MIQPLYLALLQEAGAAAEDSAPSMLIPILGMAAIFYFLVIAPDRKQRKQQKVMREELKKGDKVLSIGGIYGTIRKTEPNKIHVMVDDKVCMIFSRQSIQGVVDKEGNLLGGKTAPVAKDAPAKETPAEEEPKEEAKQLEKPAASKDEQPKRVVSER
ncbi:MAG: preprotein translocase subunit YajC [Planctomycetota bacterium]|jgi:preprotein translocase subunit YajC